MGSQSRWFRASETVDSELGYLYLLLFLCLGFLIRPTDYGHTFQRDYRGSLNLEPPLHWGTLGSDGGLREIYTTANPGAFVLEQGPSEEIAITNSTSNKFSMLATLDSSWFLAACDPPDLHSSDLPILHSSGDYHQLMLPINLSWGDIKPRIFCSTDLSGGSFVGALPSFTNDTKLEHLEISENQFQGPLPDLIRYPEDSGALEDCEFPQFGNAVNAATSAALTVARRGFSVPGTELRTRLKRIQMSNFTELSNLRILRSMPQLFLGSGNELSEVDPQRRPWFMNLGMEQIEVVIHNKIPMGTSTESPLNLPSNAICLDSIQKRFSESNQLRTPEEELVGYFLTTTIVRLQFLYTHLFKTNVRLLHAQVLYSQGETAIEIIGFKKKLYHIDELSEWAQIMSIILAGIILFFIILIMAWKRIRNMILFKSNNESDDLILEGSDLDESYLADQILYENLLKEAELVSKGSSGQVFKVKFLELECAMKVFHSHARMDFRKESITLLNLCHPHVVKVFCIFRKSFIVMELMDEDLYSFITKIRERRIDYDMPLEVALDVMLQIAEGMSYLHNQGIAHQDLKSLNILLKLRGAFDDLDFQIIAKIADLGSVRRFNPRYPTGFVFGPNINIGTRLWKAPELFHRRGSFRTRFLGLNPRILPKPLDIYGFAVICSELLTKQIPFSNDKDLQVAVLASKLREGHRPALPTTGCPEGLLALIKDCWHQDPVLRPEFHEVCARLIKVKSSWMSRGKRLES